jgi:hypothetical protein
VDRFAFQKGCFALKIPFDATGKSFLILTKRAKLSLRVDSDDSMFDSPGKDGCLRAGFINAGGRNDAR